MNDGTQSVDSSTERSEDSASEEPPGGSKEEPPDASEEEPPDGGSSEPSIAAYNAGAVGWLYRGISLVGIIMAGGGVFAELYLEGEMRSGLVPPGDIPAAVSSADPAVLTTLGIWVLLAGPGLALVSMFVSGVRRKSWPAVILAALVLVIIIGAVPIMNCIEGGV